MVLVVDQGKQQYPAPLDTRRAGNPGYLWGMFGGVDPRLHYARFEDVCPRVLGPRGLEAAPELRCSGLEPGEHLAVQRHLLHRSCEETRVLLDPKPPQDALNSPPPPPQRPIILTPYFPKSPRSCNRRILKPARHRDDGERHRLPFVRRSGHGHGRRGGLRAGQGLGFRV